MKAIFPATLLASLVLFSFQAGAVNEDLAPESATGALQHQVVKAHQQLVVTAHPLATRAGYQTLQQGGSAADAAVAIQAMLTLVEPQSSGIGGGAFMLYWDNVEQQLHGFDGRETAPASAGSDLFIGADGKPMSWWDAMVGARSVGTPGVLKMLEKNHRQFGKRPWKESFQAAINQAREGFSVTPRLHQLIATEINPGLGRYPEAKNYFFLADGSPLPVGHRLKNPQLADSLQLIADQGSRAFYEGKIANQIIATVTAVTDNPGLLSKQDLANYQAVRREAICIPYLKHRVCGFPPPTSGGITTLQIIKLLEGFDRDQLQPGSVSFSHLFSQASRLAYADRARYIADADFVDVPVNALLDPAYLSQRRQLIDPDKDMGNAAPGTPEQSLALADDQSPELPSTSHFVVIDKWGNAVSMTSSIEMAFGSTLMAGGFLLNNQLTDFSFVAEKEGKPVANRVQPGKRPRSSMSPLMVFDENNQLIAALGSPGGSRIINYVAKSLVLKINAELSLQQVFEQPHVINRNGTTELESDTAIVDQADALKAMGHSIKIRDLNSGLHGIFLNQQGLWESAVDPRREGAALGN